MATNLLKAADSLRDELSEFYWTVRRGGDTVVAAERLQAAVHSVEGEVTDPEERVNMVLEQRWGYVQLVSLIQTARYELRQLGLSPLV
jgi:hypothetical protein